MGISSEHRLADPTCPRCHGFGSAPDDAITPWKSNPCSLCDGKGTVRMSVATDWILAQGRALESSNPPPRHDPDKLPDTEPEKP